MSDDEACMGVLLPHFGWTVVHANNQGITQLKFRSHAQLPPPGPEMLLAHQYLEGAIEQVKEYLSGSRQEFDLPVDFSGMNTFQQQVLKITCEIPFGSTRTYGDIAVQLGSVSEARAVGAALASNPIPIIIPCHRVVSSDGHLRGYSGPGGIETKAWLLQHEGARLIA